jgi:rhodanese-related sulfurtransferase
MRITRILVLVAAGVLCAAVWNLAAPRERKLAWVGSYSGVPRVATEPGAKSSEAPAVAPANAAASGTTAFLPHPDRASVEIGADAVEQLHRQGVLFLDARRSSVYKDGHIPGARSFPVWESDIDTRVKALFEEGRDQRAPIVIYCSGGDCEDSHMLAEKLYFVGFDNALIYKDGFPDWQKRGGAASKGDQP